MKLALRAAASNPDGTPNITDLVLPEAMSGLRALVAELSTDHLGLGVAPAMIAYSEPLFVIEDLDWSAKIILLLGDENDLHAIFGAHRVVGDRCCRRWTGGRGGGFWKKQNHHNCEQH